MLKLNDIFKIQENEYVVIDETKYNNNSYVFVNMLNDRREPTKKFLVYKNLEKGIKKEKDEKILRELLAVFSKNMNDKLVSINRYYLKDEI